MESITLYFGEGSSDKVYQATIEPKDGGYVVHFAYGRRGSTLNTGTKTQSPLPYAQAKSIYDKLIKEKQAKGYTPGAEGTPYQQTDKAALTTGIHCQLLNPIEAEEVEHYLGDRDYLLQPKHDGRRLLIQKQGREIAGINRKGLVAALPKTFVQDAENCPMDFVIDGEAVGETLHAFDILSADGRDMTKASTMERLLRLMNVLASFTHPHIDFIETAYLGVDKRKWFEKLKAEGQEGVVFKHVDKPYVAGRPATRGSQLKYKFYETAALIVGKVNAKRSVSLLLDQNGTLVPAGNVTIPPNHEIPAPGTIVECRYLYAFRESGCIYQPTYLGGRDDLTTADCTVDQLKFKAS